LSDDPVAVVLAAGVGSRLGDELPKQFVELHGTPVLGRTLAGLAWCSRIVVVHHPQHLERTREVVEQACGAGQARLVPGGSTRRLSITAALAVLDDLPDDVPLILQNAASPNTPRQLFVECLQALRSYQVAQAYVPALHTIFSHEAGKLTQVLKRTTLGYSADPTVYRLGCLRRIMEAQKSQVSEGEMTLDTARELGLAVRLVASPETNIKLTTRNDLIVLRAVTDSALSLP
jgi:2-C-methyl-D-erythritol 4-phosphate cytidylyltransferase